jgi:hypothetical protein
MSRVSRKFRRGAGKTIAAGFALALVGGSALTASVMVESSGAAALPHVPACTSAALVEWINTNFQGAAGSLYSRLNFTNLSGGTCTLRGYPGVSAITLGGMQLGRAGSRDGSTRVTTVTLAPGANAVATLRVVDVGVFTTASCHQTTAAGFRIYAPNQTVPKTIPYPFAACKGATGPVYINIQAVRP